MYGAEMYYTTRWLKDIHTKQTSTHASFCCIQNAIQSMFTTGITDVAQQFQICNHSKIYKSLEENCVQYTAITNVRIR